jgi:hypothetical protein
LLITEGDKLHVRKHRFIIYHALALKPEEATFDYRNLKELYKRSHTKNAGTTTVTDTPNSAAGTEITTPPPATDSIHFNNIAVSRKVVAELVLQKIGMFNEVVNNLLNKRGNVDNNIASGMALFNNDKTKMVTVTNLNHTKNLRSIDLYLYALSKLNYYETKVTSSKFTLINNLRKNPDGFWHGTAGIEQEFDVTNPDGKNVFRDITQKTIEIIIQVTETIGEDGSTENKMIVFLGNINVVENR